MADEYDGIDDETLRQKLEEATVYDERSKIRKALRERKKAQQGDDPAKKKRGSTGYTRPGFQAPKVMTIPNSVTGNVLPDRVHMDKFTQKEKPKGKATISYLEKKTVVPPYTSTRKSSAASGKSLTSPRASVTSPRASVSSTRSSVSSITPEPTLEESLRSPEPDKPEPRTARLNGPPREPTPEPVREPTPEPPREPTPEPPREPTPEPPREPTPEPPREPTPEPPREPTPEPPREPTPEPPRKPTPEPPREPTPEPPREPTPEPPREPTPEPPREPTPEPPREPTPEPVREPTPEPVREPTPEPERSPTPPQKEEVREVEVEPQEKTVPERRRARDEESEDEEDEDEEEDEEETDEEEEDSDEEHDLSYDERHQYRSGRSFGADKDGPKGLPRDVMSKEEKGVRGGDFRTKLQKVSETKIDTKAAFPQMKAEAVQLDFRTVLKRAEAPQKQKVKSGASEQTDFRSDVLKKSEGPLRKQIRSGAAVQTDFRGSLKRRPKDDKTPEKAPKPSRRREEPSQEATSQELPPEEAPREEKQKLEEETDSIPVPAEEPEPSEYEARRLERQKRREQRKKELGGLEDSTERVERESQSKSPVPSKEPALKSPPPAKTEKPVQNGTGKSLGSEERSKKETSPYDLDSYEARREARRKAREERLKAAAAHVEEKQEPRLSYRERKAKEQMQNAHDSRKKWENREEDSGDKERSEGKSVVKKKDTATQQLLVWCQHKTRYYENVNVKDFRQSWSDGLAFCAIMHSFLPDKIPYDDLSADDPRKNFTIAFEAAKEAGIPEMLDVDDMILVKIPDAKSIMTFLVTIYQHFNS